MIELQTQRTHQIHMVHINSFITIGMDTFTTIIYLDFVISLLIDIVIITIAHVAVHCFLLGPGRREERAP